MIRLKFVQFWKVWEKVGVPFSAELVELFCIPYRLISHQISGEEWASTRVDCCTKAEAILISAPQSGHMWSAEANKNILNLYSDPWSIIFADLTLINFPCTGPPVLLFRCGTATIGKSWFLYQSANLDWTQIRTPTHRSQEKIFSPGCQLIFPWLPSTWLPTTWLPTTWLPSTWLPSNIIHDVISAPLPTRLSLLGARQSEPTTCFLLSSTDGCQVHSAFSARSF